MENIAGYARVLARARVGQELTKPFLGKAHIKYGQCYAQAGYFLQVGAVLGAKYSDNLDAFGHAFLGMRGDSGAVKRFFTGVVDEHLKPLMTESTTFPDYVNAEQIKRFGYSGDAGAFFMTRAALKITPDTAAEMAWQFAEQGAALGAICPDVARRMFERTHTAVDKGKWDLAHAAGLNIPMEQDRMNYKEVEDGENEVFMAYCQECCPDLERILSSQC